MIFTTRIKTHEIGLRFRRDELTEVLHPGVYRRRPFEWIQILDTGETQFTHRLLDRLLAHEGLRALLHVVDLKDTDRALVFVDDRLAYLLGPGLHAFWKEPKDVRVEVHDIGAFRFQHARLETVLAHQDAQRFLQVIRAHDSERVLIYRNGRLVETFGPGTFAYWLGTGSVDAHTVDLREQVLDVSGQEFMTADKVTLRVNLMVTFRIVDAAAAHSSVGDASLALYREAQLALRTAVGGRTLDQLLTDKDAVAVEVRAAVDARAKEFGVRVAGAGIRDVILPGEMKTILNQVIEAQKRAEANLIRRREETAAARSQANTARLLADNPVLRRFKELEMLQEILAGTKTTIVLGQGDLAGQVRSLLAAGEE